MNSYPQVNPQGGNYNQSYSYDQNAMKPSSYGTNPNTVYVTNPPNTIVK
jgi:hypothetical protein